MNKAASRRRSRPNPRARGTSVSGGGGGGGRVRNKGIRVHACQLKSNSYSCLPLVSPRRSRFFKYVRHLRKQMLMSRHHYRVQAAFVSLSNVTEERRRHLRTNRYAIHPFSNFMVVYEMVMAVMALVSLFKDPYLYAFDRNYNYKLSHDAQRNAPGYTRDGTNYEFMLYEPSPAVGGNRSALAAEAHAVNSDWRKAVADLQPQGKRDNASSADGRMLRALRNGSKGDSRSVSKPANGNRFERFADNSTAFERHNRSIRSSRGMDVASRSAERRGARTGSAIGIETPSGSIPLHVLLNTAFDVLLMALSLFNFAIGYMAKQSVTDVVLDGRKIARRYALLHFPLDFCTVPLHVAYYTNYKSSLAAWYMCRLIIWARIVRMVTYERYLRQLTVKCGIGLFGHRLLTFCLWSLLMVHWINCLYCLFIKFLVDVRPQDRDGLLLLLSDQRSTLDIYVLSLFITSAHLYNTGELRRRATNIYEQFFLIFVLAIGKCFIGIIVCQVFGMVRSTVSSRAKYDALVNELRSFSKLKRLPTDIERRLIKYYRVRFDQKYFKEQSIMAQLTDTLIREIKYATTRSTVETVPLFSRGLPQHALETYVCRLDEMFYLENDVISRAGTTCDGLYLLAYGTCAIINVNGFEVAHLDDGRYFGVYSMLRNDGVLRSNAVAITHCLIYRMCRADFITCIRKYELFKKYMLEEVEAIGKLIETRQTMIHVDQQITIIDQLRNRMILESQRERN